MNPSPPGSLRDSPQFRGEKGSKKQSGIAGDIEGRTPGETGEQWRVLRAAWAAPEQNRDDLNPNEGLECARMQLEIVLAAECISSAAASCSSILCVAPGLTGKEIPLQGRSSRLNGYSVSKPSFTCHFLIPIFCPPSRSSLVHLLPSFSLSLPVSLRLPIAWPPKFRVPRYWLVFDAFISGHSLKPFSRYRLVAHASPLPPP